MKNPWILPTKDIITIENVIKNHGQQYKNRADGIIFDTNLVNEYRLHIVFEGELIKCMVIHDITSGLSTYTIKTLHKDVCDPLSVHDDVQKTIDAAESPIQYGCKVCIGNETVIENISKQLTQNIPTGKFALGLAFAICSALDKIPKLFDGSMISCSPHIYFSLARYKLLTTGKTWYEAFISRRGTKKRLQLQSRNAVSPLRFQNMLDSICKIPIGQFVSFAQNVKDNLQSIGFISKKNNVDALLVYNSPGYVNWLPATDESSFWNDKQKQLYIDQLNRIVSEFSVNDKRSIKTVLRTSSCIIIYTITEIIFSYVFGIRTKTGETILMPEYKKIALFTQLLGNMETVMIIKERAKTRRLHHI